MEDKTEPFFPFGVVPGMITIFHNTTKEHVDTLLDEMLKDNSIPLIHIKDKQHPLCQQVIQDNGKEFGQHFKSLIIPMRYTKVFTA